MSTEKMTQRRGLTNSEFRDIVSKSISKSSALKEMNQTPNGSNYRWFDMVVEEMGLDTSHFLGQSHLKGKKCGWTKELPIEEVFVENSTYLATSSLKNKIRKYGLIDEVCSECGLVDVWNGKSITLHLDHINGNCRDNRIQNLRYLCPNCHSQTNTYAGRNKR